MLLDLLIVDILATLNLSVCLRFLWLRGLLLGLTRLDSGTEKETGHLVKHVEKERQDEDVFHRLYNRKAKLEVSDEIGPSLLYALGLFSPFETNEFDPNINPDLVCFLN